MDPNQNNQTPPPPSPAQPMNPKSGLKSKWPIIVIGLLILVLLPLGAYFLLNENSKNQTVPTATPTPFSSPKPTSESASPTPVDETADWKTYTNTASGYSVKYPSDIYVRLICPDEELVLRTRSASDTKDEETFETCG